VLIFFSNRNTNSATHKGGNVTQNADKKSRLCTSKQRAWPTRVTT